MAEVILKRLGTASQVPEESQESQSSSATETSTEEQIALAQEINRTCSLVKKQMDRYRRLSRYLRRISILIAGCPKKKISKKKTKPRGYPWNKDTNGN